MAGRECNLPTMNRTAATVTRFCEQIATATGLAADDLRVRAKYLREAGMLPQSGRGRGATPATTADAAKILLAALGGGMQNRSPQTVAALWQLKYSDSDRLLRFGDDTRREPFQPHPDLERNLASLNFGALVCFVIDECRTRGGREGVLSEIASIHVWQSGESAMIETKNGIRYWLRRPITAQSPAAAIAMAPVTMMASLPIVALALAADLTLHPADLPSNQPELPLSETKDAPRPMASGASNSVSRQDGNPVDPQNQSDSATYDESEQERESGHPSARQAVSTQGDPYGSIVAFRAAAVA